MKIYYQTEKNNYKKQIKYIFDLFSKILGITFIQTNNFSNLKEEDILISYSKKRPKTKCKIINIIPSNFFGKNYLGLESLPKLPLNRYNNLPIIYQGKNKIEKHIKKYDKFIETDIDIIASSFFMITRYEEIIQKNKNKLNGFPATATIAYKENFLNRPIVNEYIELLWSWINNFNMGFKRKKSWGNKDFAVCLTHDIDHIKKYRIYPPLGSLKRALQKRKIKKAFSILKDYLKTKLHLKKDLLLDTFEYIINLEQKYNFNSSFYFITNNKDYSLNNSQTKNIITKLNKKGFEIGIHPSFNAYNNLPVLKKEKAKLEQIIKKPIMGGRQHYLKWECPQSWNIWEEANLQYDSTVGFNEYEGFRSGICHPFQPFDIINNKIIKIYEVPLILMDWTLIFGQKLSPEKGLKKMLDLLKLTKKYHGVFVLLWHNSYMTNLFTPKWKKCFEKFYSILAKENCIVSSVKNIINQWEKF